MSLIKYGANSPYGNTTQSSWHVNRFAFRPIPPNSGDSILTLQQIYEHRPDRLSNDLYQTPAYWWVFCVRNPFLRGDPIWGFVNGLSIIVPAASYLHDMLGR